MCAVCVCVELRKGRWTALFCYSRAVLGASSLFLRAHRRDYGRAAHRGTCFRFRIVIVYCVSRTNDETRNFLENNVYIQGDIVILYIHVIWSCNVKFILTDSFALKLSCIGHFIKRFLSLNLNKTKCVWDIIEIFYSFERPIDAIMCGI